MLSIRNLHTKVGDTPILKGLDLELAPGEVSALMGPNGSGKSTLAYVVAGRPGYEITQGEILFEGRDVTEMTPDERARAGLFLSFQYPIEVPGVPNKVFMKTATNAIRVSRGLTPLDAYEFIQIFEEKRVLVGMDKELANRDLNASFSGGEKKRNEILQMAVLEPRLAILDETDSGLDIDALKAVAAGVNALRDDTRSMLVITHYQRLLDYIVPDKVHVLMDGRIVRSGDASLAHELESRGYDWIAQEIAAA
jgi:Fe-S cluster assembly ATP-binding protein